MSSMLVTKTGHPTFCITEETHFQIQDSVKIHFFDWLVGWIVWLAGFVPPPTITNRIPPQLHQLRTW